MDRWMMLLIAYGIVMLAWAWAEISVAGEAYMPIWSVESQINAKGKQT